MLPIFTWLLLHTVWNLPEWITSGRRWNLLALLFWNKVPVARFSQFSNGKGTRKLCCPPQLWTPGCWCGGTENLQAIMLPVPTRTRLHAMIAGMLLVSKFRWSSASSLQGTLFTPHHATGPRQSLLSLYSYMGSSEPPGQSKGLQLCLGTSLSPSCWVLCCAT